MTDLAAACVLALGTALLQFLWQGALIGVLAWLALALLRNARPQSRYAVACLALLACALAPAWQLLHALGGSDGEIALRNSLAAFDSSATRSIAPTSPIDAWPALPDEVLFWIVALWATGVGALTLRMACGLLWVGRLRKASRPEVQGVWQMRLDRLALRLGLRRPVALRLIDDGDSPVSAGWWRPVVLLPASLAARMPTDLLEALLAHELAHIRRHDYLVNLLQSAVEAVLFYHPVVWWLSHRIRLEREHVADALAAEALGEPRRLAIALSQLERYTAPFPAFAQAAHGGHLMSRIQQLVRPDRRSVGGVVVLPLLGLAAVGIAFYAHAQFKPESAPSATTVVQPIARSTSVPNPTATISLVSNTSPSAPIVRRDRAGTTNSGVRITTNIDHDRNGYALVRKGREGIAMSGSMDDIDEVRAAQHSINDDFIWFRRDAKTFVVRDPALIARAEEAWKPTDALDDKMQVLSQQMEPHTQKMEAMSRRMQALSHESAETSAMHEAAASMETLSQRQRALANQQMALAQRMTAADDVQRSALQRQMETLETQQEALNAKMELHSQVLEAESEQLQTRQRPMESLSGEMEALSRPMQAIGQKMEALGKRIEHESKIADGTIHQVIQEALDKGLATPAPSRQ
ncbi:MAG: M56 family metallopeptidase [Luteimonas sp.]